MQQLDFAAIPDDLKTWRQWVVWRYQQRGEKKTKLPYSPASGSLAAVDNPGTWGAFEEARRAFSCGHFAGVAFILAPWNPFTGVDLDHALSDGQIAPWARSIVDHFHSYTEWSPSRQGLHIWLRGTLPGPRRRKGPVEMYQDYRALTLTGWHLEGTPLTIEQRQEELLEHYRHLFADEVQRQAQPVLPQVPVDLSDADLIVRAERARNGARFARWWAGNTQDYGEDQSRADLALAGMLAYWTNGDPKRIDCLFRQSGLMRNKWDQRHFNSGETYGQRTIARALAGFGGVRIKVHTH